MLICRHLWTTCMPVDAAGAYVVHKGRWANGGMEVPALTLKHPEFSPGPWSQVGDSAPPTCWVAHFCGQQYWSSWERRRLSAFNESTGFLQLKQVLFHHSPQSPPPPPIWSSSGSHGIRQPKSREGRHLNLKGEDKAEKLPSPLLGNVLLYAFINYASINTS